MGYSDENFCSNAPWKEKDRKIMVRVTQTLVCDFELDVPHDAEPREVIDLARVARLLPSDAIRAVTGEDDWYLDKEKIEAL